MSVTTPAEDRLVILDLLARYAWALDTGDYETYAMLFTPDGIFEARGEVFAGRDVIREHVRDLSLRRFPGNRHHNTQILFEEGDATRARVRSYTTHIYEPVAGESNVIRFQGYYVDVVVKIDGLWYFQERRWYEWSRDKPEAHRPPRDR